jgi:hypothetical protein
MASGCFRSAAPSARTSILSSKSVLQQSLRRFKPEKYLSGLSPRERSALRFLSDLRPPFPKLLLDTTVYLDTVQGAQPEEVDLALRSGNLWHSTVTEAELASLSGLLDPRRAPLEGIESITGLSHRYQGILITTMRWFPRTRRSSLSSWARWLWSGVCHQRLTTSSGMRTAIWRSG